jgi:hypothetical protein
MGRSTEEVAEKVLALLDDLCGPEEMEKSDYLSVLEEVSEGVESRLMAVKEELDEEEEV